MNPLLLIAIPLGLVILGMILNNFGLSFTDPPSSHEQDPAKRLAAEKESYRKFFDLQRRQSMKRLVGDGRLYRRFHLALYRYREQDQPFDSHCGASNIGNRRRQTDGSVGDTERR